MCSLPKYLVISPIETSKIAAIDSVVGSHGGAIFCGGATGELPRYAQ